MFKIGVHPFSNGSKYGWSKFRSLVDFFFPYAKNGNYEYIRAEASTSADNENGVTARDFYTFRAFAWHYIYTLLLNPLKELQFYFSIYPYAKTYLAACFLLLFLGVSIPQFIPLILGGIGLDTSTNGGTATGTSLSFNHTNTGNNLLIMMGAWTSNDTEADPVTSIKYNTVAGTREGTRSPDAGACFLYSLLAPATGSNAVLISCSSSNTIYGASASYSGVKQTGTRDAENDNVTAGASVTATMTTIADKCWKFSVGGSPRGSGVTLSAGTGTTSRQINNNLALGDGNADITPAGSTSMTWISTGSPSSLAIVMCSFAPAVTIPFTKNILLQQAVSRSNTY